MATPPHGDRLVWAIALVGAVLTVFGVLFLVAPPERPPPPAARTGAGLGVQRLDSALLAEQAELRDPVRLFLPVEWNSRPGPAEVGSSGLEVGQELARSFTGRLAFGEDAVAVDFAPRIPTLARSADVIGQGEPDLPFLGMGRSDRPVAPLPARDAHIEVVVAATGQRSLSEAVRGARLPVAGDWQPLELLVAVDRAGLVAPPVVSRSSTVDRVDDFFRDYLASELHLGERLAPGSYVVTVGR